MRFLEHAKDAYLRFVFLHGCTNLYRTPCLKGRRDLDLHHLNTKPLATGRPADTKSGLQQPEVDSTSNLVTYLAHLESVREKYWFRVHIGMAHGAC